MGAVVTGLVACSSDDDEGGTVGTADTQGTHYTPGDALGEPPLPPGAGPPTSQPNTDPDPEPEPEPDASTPEDAGNPPADAGSGSDAGKDAA